MAHVQMMRYLLTYYFHAQAFQVHLIQPHAHAQKP